MEQLKGKQSVGAGFVALGLIFMFSGLIFGTIQCLYNWLLFQTINFKIIFSQNFHQFKIQMITFS